MDAQQNQYRYSQNQMIGNGNEYVSSSQYQHNGSNGSNGNYQHIPSPLSSSRLSIDAPKEILSVSGKKKCSYCSEELGKNATYIFNRTHKLVKPPIMLTNINFISFAVVIVVVVVVVYVFAGRGAAMIIESLRLFYHLDCFKCCVCRIQLGDGVSGADVRVRNQKLHCNNCFSSDDGVKFSCV